LQGLSLKNVKASIWTDGKKSNEEFGEMLFTHFGVSGPIILTLSRFIAQELHHGKQLWLSIDLKPALDDQQLDARLLRDLNEHGKKQVENAFKLWLPGKLIPVFMKLTAIEGTKLCNQVNAAERKKIRVLLKDFRFKISGYRPFKEAIITSGGINTAEINFKTMESKIVRNLYFAGEVIDLDADTGGYNLQIAWSTGYLAGESAAVAGSGL
jgi:predicted Rossmann fold flavoprotein